VEINTIDKLCNILQCTVEEIMERFSDDNLYIIALVLVFV